MSLLLRLLKSVLVLVALISGAIVVSVLLIIEDEPTVRLRDAPTPEHVLMARRFMQSVRAAANAEDGRPQTLAASEAELDSVVRLGTRLVPGFRGELEVGVETVQVRAAVPVPWPGGARWLNLMATVPEFENGIDLEDVAVGPLSVPPGIALELGRIGGSAIFGADLVDAAMGAASHMRIAGNTVTFDLAIAGIGENGIMRGVFGALRGQAMPPQDLIDGYYVRLREAMDAGDLPDTGSFLPYIVFTLEAALDGSREQGASDAYTAAMFALTSICGAQDFGLVVGGLGIDAARAARNWQTECADLRLNGRIDSRRHFITAATLKAVSNRNVATNVGEFKELFDTLKSGGFDFTDLAANNSGIRLSDRFMTAPVEEWPALIARIDTENDVIVPFDDIPQILSQEDFTAKFGSVESADYAAMLAHIEAQIDDLRLHAPR